MGGTYLKLYDDMPDHPKIDGLSDKAFRCLIELWCWCSRHLTDGVIAPASWSRRPPKVREELVSAGLVDILPDGAVVHDYLHHQRSAAEVAAMRERRRVAGQAGGQAKAKQLAKQVVKQNGSKLSSKSEAYTETESVTDTELTTLSLSPPSAKPPRVPKTRPLPEDWQPSQRIREWFFDQKGHHEVNYQRELGAFIDYCDAHRTLYADPDAAFRNWLRNRLPGGRFYAR